MSGPSSTVVRLTNGSTIQVRSGVLRGAGPQGPLGPIGPTGPAGAPGPTGPTGSINDVMSHLVGQASVATGGDTWTDVTFESTPPVDEVLSSTGVSGVGFAFASSGRYLELIRVRFDPRTGTDGSTAVAGGSRRVRLVNQAGVMVNETSVAAAPSEPTVVLLATSLEPDPTFTYRVQAYSDDSTAVAVTTRSARFIRIGAGAPGPTGSVGPTGPPGPQGVQGPSGSAGSGYVSYNALIGGGDSTADVGDAEGSYAHTADQAIPVPSGTQSPATPWMLRKALRFLETLLVARFTSAADRTSKRGSRSAGEITVLADTGALNYREKNGTDTDVARVVLSTSAPPGGAGAAAPGVIWAQY